MEFFKNALSGLSQEPMFLLMGLFVVYLIVVPILSFFLDFWFVVILITVILVLGWFAVSTVYKDQNKIGRGRLNNVP